MSDNIKFIEKLRSSSLRPTKQRVNICKILFDRKNTFHFTIYDLHKIMMDKNEKVSLATVYNTVHALKNKGYLKEISLNTEKSYFDTNISNHHHFLDEETNTLLDLDEKDIEKIKVKKKLAGKKIKSIEVLVRVANNN
tara:strand:- start:1083 stop:1496 length:414 start_codon:yes stop_codon:yes gene_type:complete